MKHFLVAGDPVEHSLSPEMHNAALKTMGLENEYTYSKKQVKTDELAQFADSLKNIEGANITIPHKVQIIKYLDELTKEAHLIGSVNTIYKRAGKLIGHNTDGKGAVDSLLENISIEDKTILIIGAGGASRAIAFSLALNPVKKIILMNRTREKAEILANDIMKKTFTYTDVVDSFDPEGVDIIINCTSLGLRGFSENASPIEESKLRKGMTVMDIVYNPIETKLLKLAKEKGCKVVNGVGMFVNQGAIALETWTGKIAPRDVMRQVVLKKLIND